MNILHDNFNCSCLADISDRRPCVWEMDVVGERRLLNVVVVQRGVFMSGNRMLPLTWRYSFSLSESRARGTRIQCLSK